MDTGTIVGLVVSSLATITAVIGIGWFGLDRLRKDLKEDSQRAHDLMGNRIGTLQGEIGTLRSEISELRKEMTALTGRVGRIEGLLEKRV